MAEHTAEQELLEAVNDVLADYADEVGHVDSITRLFYAAEGVDPQAKDLM